MSALGGGTQPWMMDRLGRCTQPIVIMLYVVEENSPVLPHYSTVNSVCGCVCVLKPTSSVLVVVQEAHRERHCCVRYNTSFLTQMPGESRQLPECM